MKPRHGAKVGAEILRSLGLDPAEIRVRRLTLECAVDEAAVLSLECISAPPEGALETILKRYEITEIDES